MTIEQAYSLAVAHHRAGRVAEAEKIYREILSHQPNQIDTLLALAALLNKTNRQGEAVQIARGAIAFKPSAEFYNVMGLALAGLKQHEQAIEAFESAIRLNPNFPDSHSNLASVFQTQGRLDQAIAGFQAAVKLKPDLVVAHLNLANIFWQRRQLDQSAESYRAVLRFAPNFAHAHYQLANISMLQNHAQQAVAEYHAAIRLQPDLATAHNDLGLALYELGSIEKAADSFRRAIELNPNLGPAHHNLANMYKDQGRMDEAVDCLRRAMAISPDNHIAPSNLIYHLHFHPAHTSRMLRDEQKCWNDHFAEPLKKFIRPFHNEPNPDRRLKIGYVSSDFRDHCMAIITMPLLSNHDHERFEIFCYADVPHPDWVTERFKNFADQWRDISSLSDEQTVELIRADSIDILIDLTMHMSRNRLLMFARKPAPVQATWFAYPGSTGLTAIDYRISDPYLDPADVDESLYSEKTIRLPYTFWGYDPQTDEITVNPLPAMMNGFVTFGCLNNYCKVNDDVIQLWSQVLHAVPDSHMLIWIGPGDRESLLKRIGVDPKRIALLPRMPRREYLQQYHRIDISLDTFPYNGHTTSLDAMWMGVPTVTLVGQTIVGRAGLCQLSNVGLEELIAYSKEDYLKIAVELANDLPRLSKLRSMLRSKMEKSPLMDGPRFARNLESAYRTMWRTWCKQ